MSSRWTGFFVWALVAACAAFWGLRIFAATRPVPPGAVAPQVAVATAGSLDRLFGATVVAVAPVNAPPPASARFQLVGVIAPRGGESPRAGLAIVSIDNQPAHAWKIGATLDGDTTLLSVAKRTADFGPAGGPTAFSLTLPEPSAAETGSLPTATSQSPGGGAAVQGNAQRVAQQGIPGMVRGGGPNNTAPVVRRQVAAPPLQGGNGPGAGPGTMPPRGAGNANPPVQQGNDGNPQQRDND